jgi:hypothetical protein
MKKISILTLSLALSMGLANAAIVLQDDAVAVLNNTSGTDTLTDAAIGGLDVSSGDKLVVTIGFEGDDSGPNSTVTYNGQNMTLAVENTPATTSGWVGIYYLDNVSSFGAGTLDFTNGGYSAGVSFMVLSGTAAGVGNVNSADATTLNLNVSANSFMVAAFGDTADADVTVNSPLQTLLDVDTDPGFNDGSASYGTGYQSISSAGTATPSFTSTTDRPNMVAAEFTAVPEPSTILLLGALGSLVFLRRRR